MNGVIFPFYINSKSKTLYVTTNYFIYMVNKTCYRAGILFDEPEEHTRPNPLSVVFQSGKKALMSPIEREPQRTLPNPLDRFFEYGGKPAPVSQPILKPQEQVQPKPQPKAKIRGRAPTAMTPEKAKRIAKYQDQQSKITLRERKHSIRLLEAENTLKRLIQVSAQPTR